MVSMLLAQTTTVETPATKPSNDALLGIVVSVGGFMLVVVLVGLFLLWRAKRSGSQRSSSHKVDEELEEEAKASQE
jgi:uncharacterized membrane protein